MTHCFRLSVVALLGFALAGALGACTDNHINNYYPGTGDGGPTGNQVSATIGQEGGSLRVTDPSNPAFGAGVDVPPGSVAQDTTIGISPEATTSTPVASGASAGGTARAQAGPVINITPNDSHFTAGQTVRISVPAPVVPTTGTLSLLQFKSGAWTPVTGSGAAGDGVVTGDVDSLGLFCAAILGGGPPPADTTAPSFAGVGQIIAGPGVGQVTLSWLAASDTVTPTADIVYEVWQSVVDPDPTSTPVAITDSGALSIILSATPGVSLSYLVRARDVAGNVDTNLNIKPFTGN